MVFQIECEYRPDLVSHCETFAVRQGTQVERANLVPMPSPLSTFVMLSMQKQRKSYYVNDINVASFLHGDLSLEEKGGLGTRLILAMMYRFGAISPTYILHTPISPTKNQNVPFHLLLTYSTKTSF